MSVFGVYGVKDAAQTVYFGLHALQHRGQEGAGLATFEPDGSCLHHRGLGLAGEVLSQSELARHHGTIAIGSTKYANAAQSGLDNVQPLFFRHKSGDFAIAGEGKLINSDQLYDYLENRGCIFHTGTDSEILANLIKKESAGKRIDYLIRALNMMEGGFTFVIMTRSVLSSSTSCLATLASSP